MKARDIFRFKERIARYDDGHNFTCDICGREVFGGERFCAACRAALPYNRGVICPLCGRRQKEEGVCLACKQKPLGVEKARSVFVHEKEAARLVVRYKRGQKYLAIALAGEMAEMCAREFPHTDAIVAVPMTEKAVKKRGYNQAALLAERIGTALGVPVLTPVRKTRDTGVQKFMGRRDREENLAGSFHVSDRKGVKGRRILIVDDTLTTGATISALADALRRAGAASLFAATVTSVEPKHPFGLPPEEET